MEGVWADVPWLAIFRRSITDSAQNGVYIVYLLSSDASAIYLTFNQGVTDPIKNVNPYLKDVKDDDLQKNKGEIIQKNVEIVRNKIDKRDFLVDDGIHLANGGLGKQYEKGTIFYKKYDKGTLPPEEQLQKDLKEMLEIYEEFYDKFYTPQNPSNPDKMKKEENMNVIFFGAPGTGKSHKIDYNLFKDKDGNPIGKGIKEISEDRKFRTTFHPDYDYAQFVGAYKPKKVQNFDNGLLSKEQLAKKLAEAFPNNGDGEIDKTTAITLFGLQYANSLKEKNMNEIVRLSEIGPDQYKSAYLSAAVKARLQLSDVDEKITYSFVPQVFAKAYAAAWKLYLDAKGDSRLRGNDDKNGENDRGKDIQVYLVIEEINRGNCAQIFGDIFQLLDRVSDGPDKGFSQYSIDADCDFAEWLKEDSILKTVWSEYETKVGDGKLKLPPNLNILATMNTSDQSLFPMDSAFKRRFDWEYVPISFDGKDAANYQIDIDGSQYSWQNFVEAVNDKILDLTESEDKQLGEFFIKPDSGNVISKERFLGKVMFYLWNEVCKDEHKNGSFFRTKDGDKEKYFTFQDLYRDKGLLKRFIEKLFEKGPSRE